MPEPLTFSVGNNPKCQTFFWPEKLLLIFQEDYIIPSLIHRPHFHSMCTFKHLKRFIVGIKRWFSSLCKLMVILNEALWSSHCQINMAPPNGSIWHHKWALAEKRLIFHHFSLLCDAKHCSQTTLCPLWYFTFHTRLKSNFNKTQKNWV